MREILFRGKEKGQWVYGYYWKFEQNGTEAHVIRDGADNLLKFNHICEPESIGQYTGLTDKNGKKIFEGDIIKHYGKSLLGDPISDIGVVTWDCDECFLFRTSLSGKDQLMSRKDTVEVLGNIHDNPELVEGDADD